MKGILSLLFLLYFGLVKLHAQSDTYSTLKVYPKEIIFSYPQPEELLELDFEVYGFSKTGDSTLIDACSLSYTFGKSIQQRYFAKTYTGSCCDFRCIFFNGKAGDQTYILITDTVNQLRADTLWVWALRAPVTLQPMDTIVYLKNYMQYEAFSGKSKLTKEINWSVSDTSFATIDGEGKLYAKKEGDVKVMGSVNNNMNHPDTIKAHLSLKKHEKGFLSISPFLKSITLRDTLSMKAIAYYTNQDSVGIHPVWTISNSNLARIDVNGTLIPIDTGMVIVQAKKDSLVATAEIKIENPLLSLQRTSSFAPLIKHQTRKLELTGVFANGDAKDLSNIFKWTVSDTNILSLDKNSRTLKGLKVGSALIKARWQGASVSFPCVVINNVVSMSISPTDTAILENDTLQYSVTGKLQDGSVKSLTNQVQYQVKMDEVATINQEGLLQAKATGSTSISAIYEGDTTEAKVEVVNPLETVLISPQDTTISIGDAFTYAGTAVYKNGKEKVIQENEQWLSLNTKIATIHPSTGEVTTLKKGRCRFVLLYNGVGSREATLNVTD